MPFKERSRQFWFRVNNDKCAYEEYDEKTGFRECGERARQVHHIRGEADQLAAGEDPEHSVGMPLCQRHHVRNTGEDLGDPNSSFHPDIGEAYRSYGEWKDHQQHLNSINGRRSMDYSTSPFTETANGHREKIGRGERYINGDEGTDNYYEQKMRDKATRYLAEHPEEEKPDTKPHPRADRSKKKRWFDGLF